MADVHIRAVGSNEDALRSIAELKAALASLHNETIRVRVEQERLGRSTGTGGSSNPIQDVRRFEQARVQEVDRAERAITNTVQRETRRRQSILGGVGRDIRGSAQDLRSFLPQTGPRGFGAVGAGIGAGVSMLGPLRNLTGLVGALPAVFGAAGIAATTFALVDMKSVTKAAADQEIAQKKLAAGTITAAAAQKAMKNAVIDLTAAQKSALPWARNLAEIHDQTANTIQRKLLPAIGALGRGLEANKRTIMSTLSVGAANIAGGLTGIGASLTTTGGRAGVSALGRSSNMLLGAGATLGVSGMRSFLAVATAAEPMVRALSADIAVLGARFAAWSQSFSGQQALSKWFSSAEVAAKSFSHVIFNVFAALNNVALGAQGTGGVLDFLDKMTNAFANWTGSAAGQKSIGEGISAAGAALRQLGSDLQFAWGVAKPFLNTLHQIATVLREITPGGANTLGIALAANFATGGLGGKIIGRGVEAMVGGAGARMGFGAAAGQAAAGGGGVAAATGLARVAPALGAVAGPAAAGAAGGGGGPRGAGGGGGGGGGAARGRARVAPALGAGGGPAAAIAAAVAGLTTGTILLANWIGSTTKVATEWRNVGAAIHAANAAASTRSAVGAAMTANAAATTANFAGVPSAKLAVLTAQQNLASDKRLLGQTKDAGQRQILRLQIQVDSQQVQVAIGQLSHLRQAIVNNQKQAETNRETYRATAESAKSSADAEVAAVQKVIASAKADGDAHDRIRMKTGQAGDSASKFAAKMSDLGAKLAATSPKAAALAVNAGNLATQLHHIPTLVQVQVNVDTSMAMSRIASVQAALAGIRSGAMPKASGGHVATGPAVGGFFQGTYRGKDTIPAMIAPGEAVLNPRQIDMLGRGRVMGALAKTGGNFYDATGFAGGGFVSADSTLASARGYLGGSLGGAAGVAASHYTHIPKLLAADTKRRNFLIKDMDREQQLLTRLRRQKAALPAGKASSGKRRALSSRISHILQHTHEQREELKRKKREIATLTGELGLVPGEDRFQTLIDDIEGQRVAATVLGSPGRSKLLEQAEIGDYTRRVKFLSMFTQIKGVRANKDLYQAANVALVSRAGELDSLKGDAAAGGVGGAGGATDQHTQDVIDALQTFTAQAVQMQAVSASEISTAMDFLKSQVGSFAGGTSYVPRTGMALVHQGEAIVPAWQNGSTNSGSMQGEFKITGSDALTSAIARAITPSVQIEMGRTTRRLTRERRT